MASNCKEDSGIVFEDFFPTMVQRLGAEGFMKELQNGFRLLMDEKREVITLESLTRSSALLGLGDMSKDEVKSMVNEGDLDGDGALNLMEFCILMCRLSPALMTSSVDLLEQALAQDDDQETRDLMHI